ncbi:MAG: TIGR04086 family membrane protein [Actinomycetota bacterium]|nr:TIGR04086 family membrane protein [Actinomycetota bacterium]
MFGRDRTTSTPRVAAFDARGGVSAGAVLTGVVVAFGAMFLFSAVVGGILVSLGISNTPTAVVNAGVGAGIALVLAQLLAYLWGGYTAGRMARGAGMANGLLVPLAAILVAVAVGAIVTALGATANLNLPSISHFNPQLPISSNALNNRVVNAGLWIGLGALLAMFVGGAVGGLLGARWHTKLERQALEDHTAEASAEGTLVPADGTVASEEAGAGENDRTAESRTVNGGPTVDTESSGPPTTGGAAAVDSGDTTPSDHQVDDSERTANATSGDTRA